jgi:hypothetical protein
MKFRPGFVSNSSTASFVLLGFDASSLKFDDGDGPYYFCEEMNADYLWGMEGGAPTEDSLIIGKFITYIHSDDYTSECELVDLDAIQKEVESFRVKCGLENQPIKLWKGMCAA